MELIWGVAIGSLALIADALHMFTDLMALVRNSRLPVLTGVFQMTWSVSPNLVGTGVEFATPFRDGPRHQGQSVSADNLGKSRMPRS